MTPLEFISLTFIIIGAISPNDKKAECETYQVPGTNYFNQVDPYCVTDDDPNQPYQHFTGKRKK